jgi:hypothetical protein
MKPLSLARLRQIISGQVIAGAVAMALVVAAATGASVIDASLSLRPGPNEYNVHAWVVRQSSAKWLFLVGRFVHGRPTIEEENRALVRFFRLVIEVDDLERRVSEAERRGTPDDALKRELKLKQRERDRLQRQATATIEGRITEIAKREGLALSLPALGNLVWPPVNFEFTTPPYTLAISPRDRIHLAGTTLLREGLTLAEVEEIEEATEQRRDVSAFAAPISGVGTYPAIVTFTPEYRRAVDVAAHEWMHNYLFFKPLGFRYYQSNDLRTMNEVVADIVGREIALAVLAEWPIPGAGPPVGDDPPPAQRSPIGEDLRSLRLRVDDLLALGMVEEAETLMEETRRDLADWGFRLRKINQAFFAFTNLYAGEAGSPAAVNPIGPKLDELRRRSPSLGEFIRLVEGFTRAEDIDRALAEREPASVR